MSRETRTVILVAGERFDTKKDAEARLGELEHEQAEAYRDAVKQREDQTVRAAELLGRDPGDVRLELPPPPPELALVEVELVVAFEVHAIGPDDFRTVAVGLTLDRDLAEGETERLAGAPASDDWQGPPHKFELVERLVPIDVADALEAAQAEAAELEAAAERKARR
jgi:hypothetical protein